MGKVHLFRQRNGQIIIADSVPIKGLAKCKGIGTGCEGYDYLKYWALYIAEGWSPPAEDFAFLAGAPGATDGEDTLSLKFTESPPGAKKPSACNGGEGATCIIIWAPAVKEA